VNCETFEQTAKDISKLEVSTWVFFALMSALGFWMTISYVWDTAVSGTNQWSTIEALQEITSEGTYGETYLHVGKDLYIIKKVKQ
jgi:hypothetical protein